MLETSFWGKKERKMGWEKKSCSCLATLWSSLKCSGTFKNPEWCWCELAMFVSLSVTGSRFKEASQWAFSPRGREWKLLFKSLEMLILFFRRLWGLKKGSFLHKAPPAPPLRMHVNVPSSLSSLSSVQTSLRQPLLSAPCTRRSGRKAIRWVSRSLCLRGTGTWLGWRKWKPGTERNIPQEAAEPSMARGPLAEGWRQGVGGGQGRWAGTSRQQQH